MEYTEEDDSFSMWVDVVKNHHPNVVITKELMDILLHTFHAGMVAKNYITPLDHQRIIVNKQTH